MITYIKHIIAAAVVLTLAGCSSLHLEAAGKDSARHDKAATPHFWDEIPVSPSTTAPQKIEDDYWHGQYQRVNREVAVPRARCNGTWEPIVLRRTWLMV
jgi:hypothetical protein